MVCFFILITLSFAAFYAGIKTGHYSLESEQNKKKSNILASLVSVFVLICLFFRFNTGFVLKYLPIDYYIYFESTSFIPFAIFFFALASKNLSSKFASSALSVICLLLFGYLIIYSSWIFAPVVECNRKQIIDGVCIQSNSSSCGAATLVTLLQANGITATEQEMADLCSITSGWGTTMLRMARAILKATDNKYQVEIVKLDWEQLKELSGPCIVDTRYNRVINHVIVVFKVEDDKVEIGDPLEGRTYWAKKIFLQKWTGYTLTMAKK